MTENGPPTPPTPPAVTLEQVSALITERFTDFCKFAATQVSDSRTSTERQVSESRASFERFYKNTIGAMVLLATAATAFFIYFSGQDFKAIEASVSTKAETHLNLLDQQIGAEIRIRTENEFKTERIQEIIRQVAREETAKAIKNDSSSWHRDMDVFRADANRYVMPRRLTGKQKADLIDYLSHSQPRAPVIVRGDPNDPEAVNYAGEIWSAINDSASGWEAKFDTSRSTANYAGVSIDTEEPGQPKNPDAKHPTPDWVLRQAFQRAQINFGGSSAYDKQNYLLYVIVGRRPLDISLPQKPGSPKR